EIYPGGICWLQGQGADLGDQVLKFAKSKLGLQPPEDGDLQSQINFCWSHWLEGDVLIVVDDVSDYQHVKFYLPLREQRFKLLITTPQNSLDESFSDEGFEPLFLSITTNKLKYSFIDKDDSDGYIFTYAFLIITILFLVCSGLSLLASYVWYGSDPWLQEFTEYGWIIELIRTLIFTLAEIYIGFIVFSQELREFFGLGNTLPEYIKARNFIRIVMLAIAVATIIIVPYYHLDLAPHKLANVWN
ncbi:MAG: hypothetical protein F6K26_52385, partial [Moorea sp. SIO2I5]|nr:hypothetical protein [Moorena sp. SIO2I5]